MSTAHLSSISTGTALTRRSSEASFGKALTLLVRRLSSCCTTRSIRCPAGHCAAMSREGDWRCAGGDGDARAGRRRRGLRVWSPPATRPASARCPDRSRSAPRGRSRPWPASRRSRWRAARHRCACGSQGSVRDGWRSGRGGPGSAATSRRRARRARRRAVRRPPWASDRWRHHGEPSETTYSTPRSPRAWRLSRKARQCISASDRATDTPSTRRRSSGPMPMAERTAASRTTPPWRIFS